MLWCSNGTDNNSKPKPNSAYDDDWGSGQTSQYEFIAYLPCTFHPYDTTCLCLRLRWQVPTLKIVLINKSLLIHNISECVYVAFYSAFWCHAFSCLAISCPAIWSCKSCPAQRSAKFRSCIFSVPDWTTAVSIERTMLVTYLLLVDTDECGENNGDCDQICINTAGSYHCLCREGLTLTTDNKTCQGSATICPMTSHNQHHHHHHVYYELTNRSWTVNG